MSSAGTTMIEAHRRAGLLEAPEIQLARSLARIAGETRPEVLLAAAWALRGPRQGHICVDLATSQSLEASEQELLDGEELPWPAFDEWRATLLDSALVRAATRASDSAPLVLDGSRLYLDRYYRYERRLVDAMTGRANAGHEADDVVLGALLDEHFPVAADELDRQRLAAAGAMFRKLALIVGGPGTGKTTTVRKLLACAFGLAAAQGCEAPRVALAAPTGKAASRLRASLVGRDDPDDPLAKLNAHTIHRLLRRHPRNETRFRYGRDRKLPYDIVIVDEASMIDLALMVKLVEAVADDATLILLGDPDQLASVEAGAILGDLCGAREGRLRMSPAFAQRLVPLMGEGAATSALQARADADVSPDLLGDCIFELTKVHRFDERGGVGQLARILQSPRPDSSAEALQFLQAQSEDEGGDLRWRRGDPREDDSLRAQIVAGYRPAVEAALAAPRRSANDAPEAAEALELAHAQKVLELFERLRVLCAHNRGRRGVETFDALIRRWLADELPAFRAEGERLQPGWPLLVTENDPQLGLYNGDVGVCIAHPSVAGRLRVAFMGEEQTVRFVSPTRLPAHTSVFAMSIHKSQGSQFEQVVVLLPERPSPICTRELVYTAVTRAKASATLVADEDVLASCLDRRVRRDSGLAQAMRHRSAGANES